MKSGQVRVTTSLDFKRFQRDYYAEYASWFVDAELNRHLGPMDQDWLEAVLSQAESAGATWAVFHGKELIAVVEMVFDPEQRLPAGITAIAIRPTLRRQGIGTLVLQQVLSLSRSNNIFEHIAYVSIHNPGGRRCLEKAGFVAVTTEPDQRGYIEFRHSE